MIPSAFDYKVAQSVDHAIDLLGGGVHAKLLAGGHSLLPAMRLRFASPDLFIVIGRISDLRGVCDEGDRLIIGSMTSYADIVRSPLINEHCMVLAQTAALVGDRQVRHRGTIGGSLAHADANADLGSVLLALDAVLVANGPSSVRKIAAADFFRSWFETALEDQEILTAISVPKGAVGTYLKHVRRKHDWATVGVAAVRLDGCVRIALTSMAPTPIRAYGVEEALASGGDVRHAAARACEGTNPLGDVMASAEYREHLACIVTRRALERI